LRPRSRTVNCLNAVLLSSASPNSFQLSVLSPDTAGLEMNLNLAFRPILG
jgi:hypothetical protein